MKTSRILLLSALAVLALSCGKNESPYIDVPETINLTKDTNDVKFNVSSNVSWKMTVSDPWFKVTPKHGNGKTELRLTSERNKTGAERTSIMEFTSSDGLVQRLQVVQPAYVASIGITAPESVVVRKGDTLKIAIDSELDDWTYSISNGDWLKEKSKTAGSLVFDLDPGVKFDTSVPAVLSFTTPSDPVFLKEISILPENYAEMTTECPDNVLIKKGTQLEIKISSNVEWTYSLSNAPYLVENSISSDKLVFDVDPSKFLTADNNAVITFAAPDYANFSKVVEVKPISYSTPVVLADKSKMAAYVLDNDGTVATSNVASAYLFDGLWMVDKSDYHTTNIAGKDMSYHHWELNTTVASHNAGHGDSFTIDAGAEMKLAKFIAYHYYDYHMNDPVVYEIYAYTGVGAPDQSGDWTNWKKLGSMDVSTVYSDRVKALASKVYSKDIADGDAIIVPEANAVTARYYRFKMINNGYSIYKTADAQWYTDRIHWLTLSEVSLYAYEE